MTAGEAESELAFPFRPWVRSTCRTGMLWGVGVLALFAGLAWWLRDPRSETVGRAFGVLGLYGLLFLATLLKIWWTASHRPAVVARSEALLVQPLHAWRPRAIEYARVQAANPKVGTHSMRFVVATPRGERELFVNLGVVDGRHRLLEVLGSALVNAGLEPVPGGRDAWRRPEWSEPRP